MNVLTAYRMVQCGVIARVWLHTHTARQNASEERKMRQVWTWTVLAGVAVLVVGCGSGGEDSALRDDGTGVTSRIGNLEVTTEATAGFKVLPLKGANGASTALTVLHGAKIIKLAELRGTRKVVFESNRDGDYEIYTMNPDGSFATRLTNNTASDRSPDWSPDGTKIAFESDRDGNNEIYTMNADGSGQTRITSNSAGDYSPAWNSNGTKIAFHSHRDGNYEVYVMNADGSGQTRLTTNSAADCDPDWYYDDSMICFCTNRDANCGIYRMYLDGTTYRVTNNSANDIEPDWRELGGNIYFASDHDGDCEVYSQYHSSSTVFQKTDKHRQRNVPVLRPRWRSLLH